MKVFFITEGNYKSGYGHLTRCLAIYQGFKERNIIATVIANCDNNGKKVLGDIKLEFFNWIKDQGKLFNIIRDADIVVIDSYLADLTLYEKLYRSVKKAVYIDDTMRLNYPPGIIINGTVGAENLQYTKDNKHKYLLGLNYTPLRKAFWDIPAIKKKEKIENVLITIGGQDFRGITFQVLELVLKEFPHNHYHVVLGFNNNQRQIIKYNAYKQVHFYHSLNAKKMRDLMLKCDLAISASGQTSYELARTNTPTILIKVVNNQTNNIYGWEKFGFINNIISINCSNWKNKIIEDIHKERNSDISCPGHGVRNIVNELIA